MTGGQIAPMLDALMNLHAVVIKNLGGRASVARAFGLPPETVKSWPKRGIPARYWHRIVEMAAATMPELTAHELERTKPRTPAPAEAA